MGSENPTNTRIFFKDKQNEFEGPFTEREVQEGYRKEYFEGSSPFYFMNENEQPSDNTEFLTLDTLRAHNGIGCPFKWIDRSIEGIEEEKKREKQQRMISIEEKLAQYREKNKYVFELQKYLAEAEKQLKKLPSCEDDTPQRRAQNERSFAVVTVPASITANLFPWMKDEASESGDGTTNASGKESGSALGKKKKKNKKGTAEAHTTIEMQEREKKREDELRKFNEWTDCYADFYMEYLLAIETQYCNDLNDKIDDAMPRGELIVEHEEARLMCVEKIIRKMKKRDSLWCFMCMLPLYNYKQYFTHLIDPKHIEKEQSDPYESFSEITELFHSIVAGFPEKYKQEEERFKAQIAKKYASVRLDESRALPSFAFLSNLEVDYAMMEPFYGEQDERRDRFISCINYFSRKWKGGPAAKLMAELDAHISNRLTYCLDCKMVTGTREEYYKHLLLTEHLEKIHKPSFYPTRAVNVHMTDFIE